MKKFTFTLVFAMALTLVIAQPSAFKYQTVVRDASGVIISNQSVSFRISILEDNVSGTAVYTEDHNVTTNDFGLANLEIGKGMPVLGTFDAIDWGAGDHYFEIRLDLVGGSNFVLMGASQMLSVPYAVLSNYTSGLRSMTESERNSLQNPPVGMQIFNNTTGCINYYNGTSWYETCGTIIILTPTVTTASISEITPTTATGGGEVTNDGGASVTTRGIVWSTSENPTVDDNEGITNEGAGMGEFNSFLTGLTPETTYFVRAYAINIEGTAYGMQESFATTNYPPEAAFTADVTSGVAPLMVQFTDQSTGNPTSWEWDFGDGGTSTQQNPSYTYNTPGNYTVQLTVTNSYDSDTEIKTNYITVTSGGGTGVPCPGMPTVTDIDGNVYNTVLIGTQCWMTENLKTTKYKNGTPIEYPGSNNSAWENNTIGAYAWYNNDINWKDSYGALYNWHAAVNTNGLCPAGWHVPTDNEWTGLTTFIGGISSPNGNKLKSCRQVNSPLGGDCNTTVHPRWEQHNAHYGTDDYGFSGLPGGYRSLSGSFVNVGGTGTWWSSTENSSSNAWFRGLDYYGGYVGVSYASKRAGFSVRCLRDN